MNTNLSLQQQSACACHIDVKGVQVFDSFDRRSHSGPLEGPGYLCNVPTHLRRFPSSRSKVNQNGHRLGVVRLTRVWLVICTLSATRFTFSFFSCWKWNARIPRRPIALVTNGALPIFLDDLEICDICMLLGFKTQKPRCCTLRITVFHSWRGGRSFLQRAPRRWRTDVD